MCKGKVGLSQSVFLFSICVLWDLQNVISHICVKILTHPGHDISRRAKSRAAGLALKSSHPKGFFMELKKLPFGIGGEASSKI